jgi:hypothetical protein
MAGEIVNRVAQSPITTFKLEEYHPKANVSSSTSKISYIWA